MFVLASLMALAAAGAALDLGPSRAHDDDDIDSLPPTLGRADPGEVGDVSSGAPEQGDIPEEPFLPPPDPLPEPEPDAAAHDELIEGGAFAENLHGGLGNDTIIGGAGDDWIQGDGSYDAAGADEIWGGAGADSLAGQGGDDIIWGEDDDDTIYGGEGHDTLFGGAGNDWLSGNDGNDVLVAGGGGDDLDGGRGNDLLVGDDDPQTVWMHGGEGDDNLMPGSADFAEGQAGADSFVVKQGAADLPVIADFDAKEDQMILHLPGSVAQDAQVGLVEDEDGTMLVTVNGDPVVRMLQGGGLAVADILIVRTPG